MIKTATSQILQNYFDKIFVLTIKRTKDRHQQVAKQIEGLPFDFFWNRYTGI